MLFKRSLDGCYAKAERFDDGRILRFCTEVLKEEAIRTEDVSGAYQNYTELLEDGYTPEPLDLETLSIGDYVERDGVKYRVLAASGVGEWRLYAISLSITRDVALGDLVTASFLKNADFKPLPWPEMEAKERTIEDVLKDLPEADRAVVRKAVK